MNSHMSGLFETFVAMYTLVGPVYCCMSSLMSSFVACPCKTLFAIFTLVWFLFGMTTFMSSFVISPWKALLALFTLIGFLFSMNSFVNDLITLIRESLQAKSTLERFFFSMNSFMCSYIFVCEDLLLQYLHLYGFSLVWILSCKIKTPEVVKPLPHVWHWYGFLWVTFFLIEFL